MAASLVILTVGERVVIDDGSNRMLRFAVPPAATTTLVADVNVKPVELPMKAMFETLSGALPGLLITKVRSTITPVISTLPKSVPLVVLGAIPVSSATV